VTLRTGPAILVGIQFVFRCRCSSKERGIQIIDPEPHPVPFRHAVEEAIAKSRCPSIFNTDQGSKFTAKGSCIAVRLVGLSFGYNGGGTHLPDVTRQEAMPKGLLPAAKGDPATRLSAPVVALI